MKKGFEYGLENQFDSQVNEICLARRYLYTSLRHYMQVHTNYNEVLTTESNRLGI